MSDPKRWLDEGPPAAIEHLIRAAEAERPTQQSLARTLTALGVGVGASSAAATAGAATAAGAASGAATTPGVVTTAGAASLHGAAGGALGVAAAGKASGVLVTSGLVKWGVVVTALAAAGVAGKVVVGRGESTGANHAPSTAVPSSVSVTPRRVPVNVMVRSSEANAPGAASEGAVAAATPVPDASSRVAVAGTTPVPSASTNDALAGALDVPSNPAAPAFVVKSQPKAARPVGASPRAVAQAPSVAEPPSGANTASFAAPPVSTEHLAEEVALVDRARGALANGDAPGALAALNQYDAQFAHRKFAPEALYLRMEALLHEGRTGAARGVAQMLAQSYPTSPHAARARQVLEQTMP